MIPHSGWALPYMIGLHLVLTALPVTAGALVAARLGARHVSIRLAAGLACGGVTALLAFWTYYWNPAVGTVFSWALPLVSAAVAVVCLARDRRVAEGLAAPLLLWAAASTFLLALGFAHGGTTDPMGTAAQRFNGGLPADNLIPSYFADWYYNHGHEPPIHFGDWLSSDRPPLQVGYLLSQWPFFAGADELHAQILGTVLQQQWVLGLYALLAASAVTRLTRAGVLVAVLLTDVVFVHGFFVWPKLLSAGILLALCALVLTPQWRVVRHRTSGAALVAVLAALPLMGHGSSLFALVGIGLIVVFRGLPRMRWLTVALIVGALVVLPWSGYQRWADPPGNRLIKWQIGGQERINSRGTAEAIIDGYRDVGWSGAWKNKRENLDVMLGVGAFPAAVARHDTPATLIDTRRADAFFHFISSTGLLIVGPVVMLIRRRRMAAADRSFALLALGAAAAVSLAAALLLFGGPVARSTIHTSGLLGPLLAAAGCAAALSAAGRVATIGWLTVYGIAQLAVYVPALKPEPNTSWSVSALVLAATALIAYIAVAAGRPRLRWDLVRRDRKL